MDRISLIYQSDNKSIDHIPSDCWDEIKIENICKTHMGHIMYLGVREADRGPPTILMPEMMAPFGTSIDKFNRTTIDLSVTDLKTRKSMCSLTDKCRELIYSSGIEDAKDIGDAMLPICIECRTGDYAPRIRLRMNGTEMVKYKDVPENDTIPRGVNVRVIMEVRNIWISRDPSGNIRAGVGIYLNSASVSKRKDDYTEYLFIDDE